MNSNVFNCPICWLKYNKTIRLPITLSCGHVICKLCINNLMINSNTLICSLDKNTITVDPNNLPICYTIMDHMPEDYQSEFVCKIHPHKRIKFSCCNDNENLCSKCVQKHKKSQHEVINFNPKKCTIEDEINLIKKHIEEKQINISIQNKKFSEIKQRLIENLKTQIEALESEANYVINAIKKAKEKTEEKLKTFSKNQLDTIDDTKKCFNNNLNSLSQMLTNTMKISKMLESQNNLIYDEVIEEKKKVIQDWELFLKNFKLPCSNYFIPITKVDKRKLNDLENNLFSFTLNKYSESKSSKNIIDLNVNTGNTAQNIISSCTPCNSSSKIFLFQSNNFSTNANTLNNSKNTSNRRYYSPEIIDSQKTSLINFQGGSPKILNTHYSGINSQNHISSNGSGNNFFSNINNAGYIQTAIMNTNSNMNSPNFSNAPVIIGANSKNYPTNFTNLIMNTNTNFISNNMNSCQVSNFNNLMNANNHHNILNVNNNNNQNNNEINHFKKNFKYQKNSKDKEIKNNDIKSKEKSKRPSSSNVKKISNKQLNLNLNSNFPQNSSKINILKMPSTTNAKNNNSVNFNQNQKIQFNKSDDSNQTINDIIKNLNEEQITLNFNKKSDRPLTLKFAEKLKKMGSDNAPVKLNPDKLEKIQINNGDNSKFNKSF